MKLCITQGKPEWNEPSGNTTVGKGCETPSNKCTRDATRARRGRNVRILRKDSWSQRQCRRLSCGTPLCIDLIGPCTIGKKKKETKLHALTMIDPATGWFEAAVIPTKRADEVSNILEMTWMTGTRHLPK